MSATWSCPACGFVVYIPVKAPSLGHTLLGLYSDGRFPGRCIVVLREHREHLELLEASQLQGLWSDCVRVGRAVKAITGAERINYAVLGNATAHMHVHIIPRHPSLEDLPTRSPWNDPRDAFEMPTQILLALRQRLEFALR